MNKPCCPLVFLPEYTATQNRNSPCRAHRFFLGSKIAVIISPSRSTAGNSGDASLRPCLPPTPSPHLGPPLPGCRRPPAETDQRGELRARRPPPPPPHRRLPGPAAGVVAGIREFWGRIKSISSPPSTIHCRSAVLSTELISFPIKLASQT